MTIEKIIGMLENPATIGEALQLAEELPFSGSDRFFFNLKRQKFTVGMSDNEKVNWVGEMKTFLSVYKGTGNAATADTPREHFQNLKTDVFVSYARKDLNRVEPIVKVLQDYGWSVFWDLEIPPGETWRGYIKKRLDESRCVLVVWSQISINSDWVIAEAEEAKKRGIMVPVRLDAVEAPFGFNHIHAADLSDWGNNAQHSKFCQCIESIKSRISLPDSSMDSASFLPAPPVILVKGPPNFVRISSGIFVMGSPESETERYDDETQHQVKVSEFYLCKYAVTLAEFKKFIDESEYKTDAEKLNSSRVWDGKEWQDKAGINWMHGVSGKERQTDEYNHPVLHVSWNDANAYCKWWSAKTGKKFRLPTEAEWEYACRAGTATPFNIGENITTDQANYDGNYPYNNNKKGVYRKNTVAVEIFAPNALGLYNMHGNVLEWCSDWYGDKYYDECKAKGMVENPTGPETGSNRVLRGGSWGNGAGGCRSDSRGYCAPDGRYYSIGFRLVFVP